MIFMSPVIRIKSYAVISTTYLYYKLQLMRPLFIFFFSCFMYCAKGQSGTLDSSFGKNGIIATNDLYYRDQVVKKNDRILVLGYCAKPGFIGPTLVQLMPDGSLDAGFGDAGKASLHGRDMKALSIQADNKIVLAGQHNTNSTDIDVLRLKPGGQIDSSFGLDGVLAERRLGSLVVKEVLVQADTKIVICATSGSLHTTILLRYNSNGSPDLSFANQGIATGATYMIGNAAALQSDGKILIGGYGYTANPQNSDPKFYVGRYSGNGTPDSSFGVNGEVTTDFEDEEEIINTVALQPDGKIVAGGYARSSHAPFQVLAVARYKSNGSIDRSFADSGKFRIGTNNMTANGVVTDSSGKILIVANGAKYSLCLFRLLNDGSPDKDFGQNGKSVNDVFGVKSQAGLLNNGDIIVSGGTNVKPYNPREYVCRFVGNNARGITAWKNQQPAQKKYILYPGMHTGFPIKNAVE